MADPTPNEPSPNPAPTPAPEPAPQPTPPAAPDPGKPDDGKGGKDAILADLAKERDARQALQQQMADLQSAQQSQMDALAKALGLKADDTPPDPAALTAQIETEKANARAANMQLAIFKAAPTLEANASRLLDSASFLASIKDVDPTDEAAVTSAIKAAVESNELFKAVPAAPPTPPFPGGPRPTPPARAGSMGEAIASRIAAQNHR